MSAFSPASEKLLATVHPPLQEVARAALALCKIDFAVVQGNRTLDDQMRLYGKGRTPAECVAAGVPADYAQPDLKQVTWTLKSNHIGGNAIDVCPIVDGSLNWDNDGKLGLWPMIADAFAQAAKQTNTPIYWGGAWTGKKRDRPHFSLVPG